MLQQNTEKNKRNCLKRRTCHYRASTHHYNIPKMCYITKLENPSYWLEERGRKSPTADGSINITFAHQQLPGQGYTFTHKHRGLLKKQQKNKYKLRREIVQQVNHNVNVAILHGVNWFGWQWTETDHSGPSNTWGGDAASRISALLSLLVTRLSNITRLNNHSRTLFGFWVTPPDSFCFSPP